MYLPSVVTGIDNVVRFCSADVEFSSDAGGIAIYDNPCNVLCDIACMSLEFCNDVFPDLAGDIINVIGLFVFS